MRPHPAGSHTRTERRRGLVAALVSSLLAGSSAVAAPLGVGKAATCAVLEEFSGRVEILDESRTRIVEPALKLPVDCGAWVSVGEKGWSRFRLRDGQKVAVGPNSFVQFPDANPDGRALGDAVTLYRGELHATTSIADHELRVLTANARVRLRQGAGLVIYSTEKEETQLLALESHATLENRFGPGKRILVKAGEASSLNLSLARVVPTAPKNVALAQLKPLLARLRLGEQEQQAALRGAVRTYESKTWAKRQEGPRNDRRPAGLEFAATDAKKRHSAQSDYRRNRPLVSQAEDEKLKQHWIRKVSAVGDSDVLHPQRVKGARKDFQMETVDLSPDKRGLRPAEQAEKRRLIDELSRTQLD